MWQCPLCQSDLTLSDSSACCANQHMFDRAKSGYLNLLPVQFKKSKQPGDDKAMLRARQTFHRLQGYDPLMQTIARVIRDHLPDIDSPNLTVFDAGCGEGTYLNTICTLLSKDADRKILGAGCDIAKLGVDIASKAYRQYQFVVASCANLPLSANSIDVMLQVFAPGSAEEQSRVISQNGLLVTVDPGPDHLTELKARVYDTPKQHAPPSEQRCGFRNIATESLRYSLTFGSNEQKSALLTMTPYLWRVPSDKRASVADGLVSVTADFVVQLWQKDPE